MKDTLTGKIMQEETDQLEQRGKIIIWGTGVAGQMAYYYYKDNCRIICYVDNDARKWGSHLNGIRICPPDILRREKAVVVIAVRNGTNDIIWQAEKDFGIDTPVLFRIEEMNAVQTVKQNKERMADDICVVTFRGGLGNQMFQYAFFRNLELAGKTVYADFVAGIRERKIKTARVI